MKLWCVVILTTRNKRNGNIDFRTIHGLAACDDEETAIGLFVKNAVDNFPGFSIFQVSASAASMDILHTVINAQAGEKS